MNNRTLSILATSLLGVTLATGAFAQDTSKDATPTTTSVKSETPVKKVHKHHKKAVKADASKDATPTTEPAAK